jgi:hypothetical protein
MVVWGVEVQRDESMERRTPMRMFVKTFMLRLVVDRFRSSSCGCASGCG